MSVQSKVEAFLISVFVLGVAECGECERVKLRPPQMSAGDQFGIHVAIDDDVAVVGSRQESTGSGEVNVFRWSGSAWTQVQMLAPRGGGALGDLFGSGVAVHGAVLVIGAPGDDIGGDIDRGSVWIYRYDGSSWMFEQCFTGENAGDRFGLDVDVRGDLLIAGAYGHNSVKGAAYVYSYDSGGGLWTLAKKLEDPRGSSGAAFGHAVALGVESGEDLAVVGAPQDDADTGSATIFRHTATSWVDTRLVPAVLSMGDQFGEEVDMSDDTMIIGARLHLSKGAAFVYKWGGTQWVSAVLTASEGTNGDFFGTAVAIDGDQAVVGAPFDDDACTGSGFCDSGAAYLFEFDGTNWTEEAKLLASDADLGDNFGNVVSIDNSDVIVSAHKDDDRGIDAGAAYIFEVGHLVPAAAWASYGAGCAGTLGVPSLVSLADPLLCNDLTLDLSNASGALTVAGLFIGVSPAAETFGCCPLLVTPTLIRLLLLPSAGETIAGPVPCDCALAGQSLYLQLFHADAGGPCGWAASQGLRLDFGY